MVMDAKKKELNRAYDRLAYWAARVRDLQFGRRKRQKQHAAKGATPGGEARP